MTLQSGDVIIVRTGGGWLARVAARLIRLAAALRDQDDLINHVAVVHHTDAAGTLWAIEARPGGVGWVDVARYQNQYLLSTARQPKTDAQRQQVCAAAAGMLGIGYDWHAIGMDAAEMIGLNRLWQDHTWGDDPPAHVVCSALASWVYHRAGLDTPATPWRTTTPADWAEYVLAARWSQ